MLANCTTIQKLSDPDPDPDPDPNPDNKKCHPNPSMVTL